MMRLCWILSLSFLWHLICLGQADSTTHIHDYDQHEEHGKALTFYPYKHKKGRQIIDTVVSQDPYQYDPARRAGFIGDLNPGYIGGEVLPTIFCGTQSVGFELGHDAYDVYKIDIDTAPLFQTQDFFTDLFYAQGNQQTKSQTEVDFGGRYQNQLLSIGYRRLYNQGVYQEQNALHTAIYLGYYVERDHWSIKAMFGSNVIQDRYNYGIRTDSLFGQEFVGLPSNIPVRSLTAEGRHQERQFGVDAQWRIKWLPLFSDMHIKSHLVNEYIKMFDADPDSLTYATDIYDRRGLRQFIRNVSWRNEAQLVRRMEESLRFAIGVRLTTTTLTQEPVEDRFLSYYLTGDLQWSILPRLHLSANAAYGLQGDQGEYHLHATGLWDLPYIKVRAMYQNSLTVPDITDRRIILLNEELYNVGFTRVFHNMIGGEIHIPALQLSTGVHLESMANYRYWTSKSTIPQLADFTLLLAYIDHRLSMGLLHLNSRVAYQSRNESILPLPEWQGRHQLYFDFSLFRSNFTVNIGPELRYYLNYKAPKYNALLGEFMIVDNQLFTAYPYVLDGILRVRIRNFHFLLRLENLQDLWEQTHFYSHSRMPFSDFRFRFGARWRLRG